MRVVSFDAFRSLGIPSVHYIKPDQYLQHVELLRQADWVLFPEYWQVNALHYGLGLRLFPSISSYHIGHNKIEQTRVFQLLCPANIPDTLILNNTPENRAAVWEQLDAPFVAKVPKSSEGRGVLLIEERSQWQAYCADNPVLYVQELLPIDRDMRIVVIGRQIVGGYWRLQADDGFHNNIAQGGQLDFSPIPQAAAELVLRLAATLNIDHGGFDVAMVGDRPYVLEFNRLFGNHGLVEQGIKVGESIYQYLRDACSPPFTPPILSRDVG